MQARRLGKTGWDVSEIGFGAWAIGGAWGETDEQESLAALHAAVDSGVTFFDTADVYGDGRSERLIGRLLREREERLVVATKFGRRAPLDPGLYTYENLRGWLERSRENLGVDSVDLVQLHCPPWETYYMPEVHFDEGKRCWINKIIFNMLRQRPAELFFDQARRRGVGVIVRVPLASGLLTGKFGRRTTFAADDHRGFNRHGEEFDVGETFAGVDYEVGLEVVDELRPLVPQGATLAQLALRWILAFDGVSTVIPGAKTPEQARANAAAADLPAPSPETMERVVEIYRERVAPLVHQRW